MKIAIITSGRLPVPAVKGGAVETKLDYILDYNAKYHLHDISVYSIVPNKSIDKNTEENHYIHYDLNTISSKIYRKLYKYRNSNQYYDDQIEYFLYKCIKDIKKKEFDCIVIANRPGYAMKIQQITNTPIILQLNNDYLNINTKCAYAIKEACSLIITCSDYINNLANSVTCTKHVPVKTVYNGIDIKRFIDAIPANRQKLGLSPDDFVVFYSGRLIREKGILELIKAIKTIQEIKNIKLVIAGASFYGNDTVISSFINELKKEVETIKEKVIFTGFISYKEMPSILKIGDIAIVPSMWEEPFGLTVIEAMAAGVPLIATKSGGIPEICKDEAILIERNNIIENIANAILYLYHNPQIKSDMRIKARKKSLQFDKYIFAQKYLETIQAFYNI